MEGLLNLIGAPFRLLAVQFHRQYILLALVLRHQFGCQQIADRASFSRPFVIGIPAKRIVAHVQVVHASHDGQPRDIGKT